MRDTSPSRWGYVSAIVLAWVVVQIPFLSTAIRIDETNLIRIAEQVARSPADPYGFMINWGGLDEDAFHILANPPGVPVWLALWGKSFGWTETVLHLSIVPFGIIALLGMALLARELNLDPVHATALMLASPAFVVGAQVVMPDVAMLAWFMTALAAAMRYRRTGEWWLLPIGFLAGALAPFCKYNGALVGALLALVWLSGQGRRRGLFLLMLGPVAGIGVWSSWSLMEYGRIHFLTIAEFESGGATNILTAILGFLGLGVIPLVFAWMRAPQPLANRVLNAVSVMCGAGMAVGANVFLNAGPFASLGYGLSAAISFRFAIVVLVVAWNARKSRELGDLILVTWIALMVWFQFGLLFSSVRYLLPLLPAVILLVMRHRLVELNAWLQPVLVLCILLSFGVAIGDAKTANLYKRFANEVAVPTSKTAEGRFFFDGHWGFQYYMERGGGRILNFYRQPRWKPGDLLVIARVPFPSYHHPTPSKAIAFDVSEYAWSPGWPIRTIDCSAWANFYGPGVLKCKGPALPFGFSTRAGDTFAIYRARERDDVERDAE